MGKSPNAEEELRRKEEFENNKKKLFISTRAANTSINTLMVNSEQPQSHH
jgi:hypothetical protein